jgi:protein-tyrosine-phosphatase
MAESFFKKLSSGMAYAISAGTNPAKQINPLVVEVMKEVGLNMDDQKPKLLTIKMLREANRVISMGCDTSSICPASFTRVEDWKLPDPKGASIVEVRRIRDKIKNMVKHLCDEIER